MPGINVSALSGGDLRRLLKVAHARHDGLLADRLEWEIAARRVTVVRTAGPFATLPDDLPDEPHAGEPWADAAPSLQSRYEPERSRRPVVLVTLGAATVSLLSAGLFWTLARTDGTSAAAPPPLPEPPPARVMTLRPAPPLPVAGQPAALARAPEPEPMARIAPPPVVAPRPQPVTSVEPTAKPAASAAPAKIAKASVARKAAPARKPTPVKHAALEKDAAPKSPPVAKPERRSRPPTLDEWLAKSGPEDPVR